MLNMRVVEKVLECNKPGYVEKPEKNKKGEGGNLVRWVCTDWGVANLGRVQLVDGHRKGLVRQTSGARTIKR